VVLCCLLEIHQCFEGIHCLHLQHSIVSSTSEATVLVILFAFPLALIHHLVFMPVLPCKCLHELVLIKGRISLFLFLAGLKIIFLALHKEDSEVHN
jgi:hypothetical protein